MAELINDVNDGITELNNNLQSIYKWKIAYKWYTNISMSANSSLIGGYGGTVDFSDFIDTLNATQYLPIIARAYNGSAFPVIATVVNNTISVDSTLSSVNVLLYVLYR